MHDAPTRAGFMSLNSMPRIDSAYSSTGIGTLSLFSVSVSRRDCEDEPDE